MAGSPVPGGAVVNLSPRFLRGHPLLSLTKGAEHIVWPRCPKLFLDHFLADVGALVCTAVDTAGRGKSHI